MLGTDEVKMGSLHKGIIIISAICLFSAFSSLANLPMPEMKL